MSLRDIPVTNFDDVSFSIILSFYPDIDVVQNTVSFDKNAHYTVTCDCSGSEAEIFLSHFLSKISYIFTKSLFLSLLEVLSSSCHHVVFLYA